MGKNKEFYEKLAKKLAKDGKEKLSSIDLYRMEVFLKIIKKYKIKNKKNIELLDIGTRNGWLSDYLDANKIKNINYYALDISEYYVNLMKKKKINAYLGDITKKNPIKKQFDIIIMGEIIEHITNTNLAFDNCKKLLKSEGIIIGSVPNTWNLAYILKAVLNKDTDPIEEHIYLFDKWHLRNLFKMNGFKIKKIWVEPFSFTLGKYKKINHFLSRISKTGIKLFFIITK